MKRSKAEVIPHDIIPDSDMDFVKNTVTARDGRMWTEVTLERSKIERIIDGDNDVELIYWGVRVQN